MTRPESHTSTPRHRWARFATRFTLLLLTLLVGVVLGYFAQSRQLVPRSAIDTVKRWLSFSTTTEAPPGQWNVIQTGNPAGEPNDAAGNELTAAQRKEMEKLLSLGYVGGTVPRPDASGVTVIDTTRMAPGLRFFTSGHAPEALLMAPTGEILHRWTYAYRDVWQARPDEFMAPRKNGTTDCWRRAHLFPDGTLLAIYEGHGLIKLDRHSQLLWSYPGKAHHDLHVDEDGRIFVLTREVGIIPRLHPNEPVLIDFIVTLDPLGKELDKTSILEAFENSPYASYLDKAAESGDIFHTNTVERLDGSQAHLSAIFAAGNFLISVRELNVIAVLDPRQQAIVWALGGMWIKQHQPTLLDNGNILVFDNLGHHGRSKVVEIEPFSQRIVWAYRDGPGSSLYSKTCGSNQRLPGGNTLIVESDNGRTLEVAPEGTIVWEYRNPHRAGQNNELIAAILDMVILPSNFPLDWLPRKES